MSFVRLSRFTGLDRQALGYGASVALAAWCAFAIASLLHVQNAFWAPMAVWIVAQTSRGMLLERGIYRLVGTLIGAAVGFLLLAGGLPAWLAVLLLALWAALCSGAAHLLRAATGYAAMMAGLTASVVLLPSLGHDDQVFGMAVARLLSTLIGVVCVMLVGWWVLSTPPRHALLNQVRGRAGEALRLLSRQLEGAGPLSQEAGELVMALVELEQQLGPINAGPLRPSRGARVGGAFVAATLGVLAGMRTTAHLSELPEQQRAELAGLVRQAAAALAAPVDENCGVALSQLVAEARRVDETLARQLARLQVAETAAEHWQAGHDPDLPLAGTALLTTRRDPRSACISAAGTGVVTLAAGLFVLFSDWQGAWMPAMGLCTFTMVLSSMDLPQRVAPIMAQGVVVGVLLAALFRVLLLPHASGQFDILLMLAPFMLLGGLTRASQHTAMPALDGNMCFMLASQPFLTASTVPAVVAMDAAALIGSILLVALGFRLLPRDPGRRAAHLAETILRDVERLCGKPGRGQDPRWHGRMFRRLLRLMLHTGRAERLGIDERAELLGILNLAQGIIALRELVMDERLDEPRRQALERCVAALRDLASDRDGAGRVLAEVCDQWPRGKGVDAEALACLDGMMLALEDCEKLWVLAGATNE